MKIGYLATIQYVPDLVRNERLNIGIALHSPEDNYIKVEFSKNKKRLLSFDDEIEYEFYKMFVSALEDTLTPSISNYIDISDHNLLKSLSYNYVNQFQFIIQEVHLDHDISVHFNNFKKLQLHFDFDIKDRLTPREKFNILSKSFVTKGIEIDDVKNREIIGIFDENINFDFKFDDSYIKVFEFNNNNYKHLVNQVKVWIYNYKKLSSKIEIIFIVEDNVVNDITKNILNELKDNVQLVFSGIQDEKLIYHLNNN